MKSTKYCKGCRDNFYNGSNPLGVKKCWCLEDAKVVIRYKLEWWTRPTTKGAFEKVKTYDCHNAAGRYVLYKELPSNAVV
jgi:hypothetical protein